MKASGLWAIITSIPMVVYIALRFLFLYLQYILNARAARRAFEAQLMKDGLPKSSVKELGKGYDEMRHSINRMIWSLAKRR
jgi:uncharacterized membrane protein